MLDAGTTNLTTAIRVSVNSDECRKIHYILPRLPTHVRVRVIRAKAHATTTQLNDTRYKV